MRIIGGEHKGRKLKTLSGEHTRPTLDKVKGAIFDSLFDVSNTQVLDLFGGSGAMALEAFSRGADHCVIVENDKAAVKVINENINALHGNDSVELRFCDFRQAFQRDDFFDLIFLDPPYGKELVLESMSLILKKGVMKPGGIVVAEVEAKLSEIPQIPSLTLIKQKQYGITKILYYRFDEE